ncbi:nodulation efficiency protein NfeD [Laceyella sacchari]|uniref:NfeD family protein n=1 Tax=Laceyella tengchongensis TaxID=574699 RepID=UPI000C9F36EC|nr:nodulation efficiency protein NfeD [Laceyella sacchari]MRG29452.1 nodulation efficiency protein NfeD [Laceyella tengchongensis]
MAEFAQLLTHPVVMTLLLSVGLIGLTVELLSPGLIFPGLVGGIMFFAYFWAVWMAEPMGWEPPSLFVLGIVLLILEMLLPTLGIIGALGSMALIASLVMTASSLWVVVWGFLLALAVIWILFKFFGLKIGWNQLVLRDEQTNEAGYVSAEDRKWLLGQEGIAITPLRPSGYAQFGERKEDVVSEGDIIPKGAKVKVIAVDGMRVVVRKEVADE